VRGGRKEEKGKKRKRFEDASWTRFDVRARLDKLQRGFFEHILRLPNSWPSDFFSSPRSVLELPLDTERDLNEN